MPDATAQPRRKLTPDLIPRAREMAALGLPLALIADALGVHRGTLHRWRTEAGPEGLERDLCDAIESWLAWWHHLKPCCCEDFRPPNR